MNKMTVHIYKILGLTIFIMFLSISSLQSQDTLALNMQGLLEYCKANNNTIRLYEAQQNIEQLKTNKISNWWLPDLYAGIDYQSRNGTAMNTEGSFIDVNRQSLWSGLGIDASWDFKNKYLVKKQKAKQQAWHYKSLADKNKMLLIIIENYYDLLHAQVAISVYNNLAKESQNILDQIEIQINQGLRYPSELLLGKSYLQKIKIESLNQSESYNNYLNEIRQALSISKNIILVVVDSIVEPIDMDIDISKTNIRQTRKEFLQFEMEHRALEAEMNMYSKGMWLPELRLNTNASLFGGVFTPFDPTGIVNVSLLWQIPYDLLVNRTDIDILKAEINANDKRSDVLEDEINSDLLNAKTRIKITTQQIELAEEAIKYSSEALYQSIERQKLGTAQPLEVYQAQELNIKLKLDHLAAITKYNKAQFALFVALGNDI